MCISLSIPCGLRKCRSALHGQTSRYQSRGKHRCTDAAMEYFKSEVMEMCHREGLYQIDLLNGSKNRVTEREYWAQKKGQAALIRERPMIAAAGHAPDKPTKFETDKAKLRRLYGRHFPKLPPLTSFPLYFCGRAWPSRRAGGGFPTSRRTGRSPSPPGSWGTILTRLLSLPFLDRTPTEPPKDQSHTRIPCRVKKLFAEEKTAETAPKTTPLQRMVDREAKRAEGKGVGYDRWAAMHNLNKWRLPLPLISNTALLPGGTGRSLFCRLCRHAPGKPTELKQMETTLNGKRSCNGRYLPIPRPALSGTG